MKIKITCYVPFNTFTCLLVFILISEVLFENHVCEKVSSIKIIIIYYYLLFNHLSANVVYILFIYNSNRILTDEKVNAEIS